MEKTESYMTSQRGKKTQANKKIPTQHSTFYFYICSNLMSFVDHSIPEVSYLFLLLVLDY